MLFRSVTTPIPADVDYSGVPAAHVEETPNTPTIETLVDMSNAKFPRGDRPWSAADTLKNVVFKVNLPDGSSYALAVGLPGDREVDLRRLEAAIAPGEAVPFEDADFAARPTLAKGYIGPGALGEDKPAGVKYLLDPRVVSGTRWITGSDVSGKHVYDLVAGRDFERPIDPNAPKTATRGSGLYTHKDPIDRPPARFAGTYTLHGGPGRETYLLVPVLP